MRRFLYLRQPSNVEGSTQTDRVQSRKSHVACRVVGMEEKDFRDGANDVLDYTKEYFTHSGDAIRVSR